VRSQRGFLRLTPIAKSAISGMSSVAKISYPIASPARGRDSLNMKPIISIPGKTRISRRTPLRVVSRVLAFAFLLGCSISGTLAQKMPESAQGPSVSAKFVEGSPADYAGGERCRSCHKPE
jgi:hypothetical protein